MWPVAGSPRILIVTPLEIDNANNYVNPPIKGVPHGFPLPLKIRCMNFSVTSFGVDVTVGTLEHGPSRFL